MDGTLTSIAKANRLTLSTMSKLNPSDDDGAWSPQGIESYRAIDRITQGQYELVVLRNALDEAKRQTKLAKQAMSLAEARADRARASSKTLVAGRTEDATLVVDDVLVDRRSDRVVLDIRVRNAGERSVNITRAAVRILTRKPFLTAYAASAQYDLLIDGDHNEAEVAHHVKPDDVDRFTLTLGFANQELGCAFTAEVVLRFNRDQIARFEPVTFDSCFE
jgi:hypothetical protein